MNNIEIGSKVKVKEPKNNTRWVYLGCPSELGGAAIEDLEFTVLEEDYMDFCLLLEGGKYSNEFYFPKETVYLADAKLNPFAQDSLPIGTVVRWEGCKLKVEVEESYDSCEGCYFAPDDSLCEDKYCHRSANSDGVGRKYILINEQQEEQTMSVKLEDGKKYVTEGGGVVTMSSCVGSELPFKGSNGYFYTENGMLFRDGSHSVNNITKEYHEETKQEPEGHIHAELIIEYGKDALVSKTPWLGWQYSCPWDVEGLWYDCYKHPNWDYEVKYRRKPKTILINGYEVPEPLRIAPEEGTEVFIVTIYPKLPSDTYTTITPWVGTNHQVNFLSFGLLHLTLEAAQLHAKALLSFTTTVQEQQDD